MPQKISSDPVSDNPFYQADDWLVLSYERRVALGLKTELNPNPDMSFANAHLYKKGEHVLVDKRKIPIRLIFSDYRGIIDFPNKYAAIDYLKVSVNTFNRWLEPGGFNGARRWPEGLMCFHFL